MRFYFLVFLRESYEAMVRTEGVEQANPQRASQELLGLDFAALTYTDRENDE